MFRDRPLVTTLLLAALLLAGCAVGEPMARYETAVPAEPDSAAGSSPAPTAAPTSEEVGPLAARLAAAIDLVGQLEYARAALELQSLAPRFQAVGDATRTAEAWFWLGFCREKQRRAADARTIYMHVANVYPKEPAGQQARRRLKDLPGEE
ncbi:hypothetical protein LCGC14_0095940 [marine sediment metagenome]|uniref:Outer membrane lipoprotein BamD-like domain-containing protein n=1 Tax=marine sediment metagenome TaxID=412755 RepID=A0A0F9VES2_9ZZZZ|nr:hypothetical protein [Phycisphaerae bacterium]HDZ43610.1 hypothetical protein [Phycisphaerae bacterium]